MTIFDWLFNFRFILEMVLQSPFQWWAGSRFHQRYRWRCKRLHQGLPRSRSPWLQWLRRRFRHSSAHHVVVAFGHLIARNWKRFYDCTYKNEITATRRFFIWCVTALLILLLNINYLFFHHHLNPSRSSRQRFQFNKKKYFNHTLPF